MSIRSLVNEYLKMNGKYENESLEFGALCNGICMYTVHSVGMLQ